MSAPPRMHLALLAAGLLGAGSNPIGPPVYDAALDCQLREIEAWASDEIKDLPDWCGGQLDPRRRWAERAVVAKLIDGMALSKTEEQFVLPGIRKDLGTGRVHFRQALPTKALPNDLGGVHPDDLATVTAVVAAEGPGALYLVRGRASLTGEVEANRQLALRRVQAVKTWLHETHGVPKNKICIQGLGQDEDHALDIGDPDADTYPSWVEPRAYLGDRSLRGWTTDEITAAIIAQSATVISVPRGYSLDATCSGGGQTPNVRRVTEAKAAQERAAGTVVSRDQTSDELYQLAARAQRSALGSGAQSAFGAAAQACLEQFPLDGHRRFVADREWRPQVGDLVGWHSATPTGARLDSAVRVQPQAPPPTRRVQPMDRRSPPSAGALASPGWWTHGSFEDRKQRQWLYSEWETEPHDFRPQSMSQSDAALVAGVALASFETGPRTFRPGSSAPVFGDADEYPAVLVDHRRLDRVCLLTFEERLPRRVVRQVEVDQNTAADQHLWLYTSVGPGQPEQRQPLAGEARCMSPRFDSVEVMGVQARNGQWAPNRRPLAQMEAAALQHDWELLDRVLNYRQRNVGDAEAQDLRDLMEWIPPQSSLFKCLRHLTEVSERWDFREMTQASKGDQAAQQIERERAARERGAPPGPPVQLPEFTEPVRPEE